MFENENNAHDYLIILCVFFFVVFAILLIFIFKKGKSKQLSKAFQIIAAFLSFAGGIVSCAGSCSPSVINNGNVISNTGSNNTNINISGDNNTVNTFYGSGTNSSQNNQAEDELPDMKDPATFTAPDGMETVEKFVVGWGDNTGGRQAYAIDEIQSGVLGANVVINSISNGVIGHEFNFVSARRNDVKHLWNADTIEAEDGEEYRVRIYVHNNNPRGSDATAKDVSIRFGFSKPVRVTGNDIALDGFDSSNGYYAEAIHGLISVSNGTPSKYWDGVKFVSNRPFHLEYILGSALYENKGIGAGGYILSDDIVRDYTKIGYDEMNGEIPGCYEYASYTTILVKPIFDD